MIGIIIKFDIQHINLTCQLLFDDRSGKKKISSTKEDGLEQNLKPVCCDKVSSKSSSSASMSISIKLKSKETGPIFVKGTFI